jgi:hypothetical protein
VKGHRAFTAKGEKVEEKKKKRKKEKKKKRKEKERENSLLQIFVNASIPLRRSVLGAKFLPPPKP